MADALLDKRSLIGLGQFRQPHPPLLQLSLVLPAVMLASSDIK